MSEEGNPGLMETDSGPDLVVDVWIDGHLASPTDVPAAGLRRIEAAALDTPTGTLSHEGVEYTWSTRPCVYP